MKRILLAVTGMSPQVITETLYALNVEGEAWPHALRLITTSKGRNTLWKGYENCLNRGGREFLVYQRIQMTAPSNFDFLIQRLVVVK